MYLTGLIYFSAVAACYCFEYRDGITSAQRTTKAVFTDLRDGALFIARNRFLRYLSYTGICWRLCLGLQVSLFVVYVKSYLAMKDADYGLFMTSIGIGSILGSLIGPKLARKTEASNMINIGLGLHYALFATLGLVQSYYAALVIVFAGFATFYATVVAIHAIRDEVTGVEIRGRVYGSINAILAPPGIISMILGGYLAGIIGIEKVFLGTGLLGLASMFAIGTAFSREPALFLGRSR